MPKKKNPLTPKEKLQQENNLLKAKLIAEHNAKFLENEKTPLNPQMENQWLNYMYNFEELHKNAKQVTVYEFIGNPDFKASDELDDVSITKGLDRLLAKMNEKGVNLDCICEYDDRTIYEFVTEELFEHEIDDVQIEGMMNCFIYEEFHPNHDYDLRRYTEEFFDALLRSNWDKFNEGILCHEIFTIEGNEIKTEDFTRQIELFQEAWKKFKVKEQKIDNVSFDIDEGKASVNVRLSYDAISENNEINSFSGKSTINFEWEYGYWYIKKVVVPGFNMK